MHYTLQFKISIFLSMAGEFSFSFTSFSLRCIHIAHKGAQKGDDRSYKMNHCFLTLHEACKTLFFWVVIPLSLTFMLSFSVSVSQIWTQLLPDQNRLCDTMQHRRGVTLIQRHCPETGTFSWQLSVRFTVNYFPFWHPASPHLPSACLTMLLNSPRLNKVLLKNISLLVFP